MEKDAKWVLRSLEHLIRLRKRWKGAAFTKNLKQRKVCSASMQVWAAAELRYGPTCCVIVACWQSWIRDPREYNPGLLLVSNLDY